MPEITREIYKAVKRYDREQFRSFCKDLYLFGFDDGRESVPGIDLNLIYKIIGETRGIGPKKLAEITARIDVAMNLTEARNEENV